MTKFTTKVLTCACGKSQTVKCLSHRDYTNWKCRSCAIKNKWASSEYRANRPQPQLSQRSKAGSVEHKRKLSKALSGRKLSPTHKAAIGMAVSKLWQDDDYRQKIVSILRSDSSRELRRTRSKEMWSNEFRDRYRSVEYRLKVSNASKLLWRDDDYRQKMLASKSTDAHKALMAKIISSYEYKRKLSIAASKLPSISSLQKLLYSMLDDLGVAYEKENAEGNPNCLIGPWSFDCVIPRAGQRTLLIECNGDWVHSLPHKIVADKAKATYINTYCADTHELKYLWEHQFSSHQMVIDLLKYWIGIADLETIPFKFSDVEIKKSEPIDYRVLLQKYHYLANAGRGGTAYGAYVGGVLAGVCVFSPLPRQNISVCGYTAEQVRDLSRFCIHPNYRITNFGSWFISRCLKLLPPKYKVVVAYADTTFNHNGGLYLASNFVHDLTTPPDYWYRSDDGWVMHKKTLYNKARNLGMTESEYATKFGYTKTMSGSKLRFVFKRDKGLGV